MVRARFALWNRHRCSVAYIEGKLTESLTPEGWVPGHGYTVLANSGDTVVVYDQGIVISQMHYGSSLAGRSRALACALLPQVSSNYPSTNTALTYGDGDAGTPGAYNAFEPDGDGIGDSCDPFFDSEDLGELAEDSAELIATLDVPGDKGLVGKLTGKSGVVARVDAAIADYDAGDISTETYVSRLESALEKLDSYEAQLDDKVAAKSIDEASAQVLYADADAMRTFIEDLIADA